MADESKQQSRWWEFYFVRYFVGTVVGFGIVMLLMFENSSPLRELNFLGEATIKDLTAADVLLLSGVGLAFCYISSAPVLVFHALRSAYEYPEKQSLYSLLVPAIIVVATLGIVFVGVGKISSADPYVFLAWLFLILVTGLQVFLYFQVFRGGKSIDSFYLRLAKARAKACETEKEFLESYRHLREHGNAFLILVFEAGLGASMYLMKSPNHALYALFLWITPAAFVWFVGTYLEYTFKERGGGDVRS